MLIKVLKEYLAPYRQWLYYIVGLQLVGTMASMYLPSLNADIIDNGVAHGDTDYILSIGGWMLLVSLVQIATTAVAVYFGAKTAMAFGRDLRAGVFARVGSFSAREVGRFGAPSLITRVTNDVQQVQMLVMMTTTMLIAAPIMMVGGVIMALREDAALSWLLLLCVPILFVGLGLVIRKMVPGFKEMQVRIDDVNRVLREQITGIRVVRAFVRERFETERFAKANLALATVATKTGRYMAAMFPFVMFVMNLSVIGVLWFGGIRVDDGLMEIGALTAFMTYVMQILMAVMMAVFMIMMIPRAAVSSERIKEVLETETSVVAPTDPVDTVATRGEVDFDRVSFAYPGSTDPVLRDITFSARPGQTTAIVGSTGAGKTTLLNLIPRLFDATGGAVVVDGEDVRRLSQDLLWSKIGIVPQKAFLFSGTVASNLRYGRPTATDEELWDALEIAQARDFVAALPEGLEAPISQGGSNLSGGQRQRLAIARALVKRPEIYLFDDSFSALDVATDARLRAALAPVTRESTVLIVAQRVSTVLEADQIVVLEDGEIVGLGTHGDLLPTCPTYAEIVASQLSAEEAAA